jgi:hypothetical protein
MAKQLRLAAAALALVLFVLAAAAPRGAAAAVDAATCGGVVKSMGGGAGLMAKAPSCNTSGGSFAVQACCGQIKSLLSASGPTGAACFCNAAVFSQFSAQVNIPGFSNSAIPFFLSSVCRIPTPGRGC